MCGLVGIVGEIGVKEEKIFSNLLKLDTMRGPDSTGVLSVKVDGSYLIAKELGTPWDLMGYKVWDKLFIGYNSVLMGHNRYATKGKVSKQNAHPFEFDKVIGAHNGTLRTTHTLTGNGKFDVDSQVLYNSIDVDGVDETIENADGAFALSWYDKSNMTFNLLRNKERPLSYAFLKGGKTLVYASESWMLHIAASYEDIRDLQVIELPVGILMKVQLIRSHLKPANYPVLVPEYREIKLYEPILYHNNNVAKFPKENKSTATDNTPKVCGPTDGKVLGEFIAKFEVVKHSRDPLNKQHYIECRMLFADCGLSQLVNQNLRLFPQHLSKQWNEILFSTSFFSCKVKHFSRNDGGYYVADLRTIEKVDCIEETPANVEEYCFNCGDYIADDDKDVITYNTGKRVCGYCVNEFKKFSSKVGC